MPTLKAGARLSFVDSRAGTPRQRTGQVWSPGPAASTVWVLPDDDRRPVVVKLPTETQVRRGRQPEALTYDSPREQQLTAERCSNVSRHGGVIGVVNGYGLTGPVVVYHVSLMCPDAAGKPEHVLHGRLATAAPWRVQDILTGKRGAAQLDLCRRCVWLLDPTTGSEH